LASTKPPRKFLDAVVQCDYDYLCGRNTSEARAEASGAHDGVAVWHAIRLAVGSAHYRSYQRSARRLTDVVRVSLPSIHGCLIHGAECTAYGSNLELKINPELLELLRG